MNRTTETPLKRLTRKVMFRTAIARRSHPRKGDWSTEYGVNLVIRDGQLIVEARSGDYPIAPAEGLFHAFVDESIAKDLLELIRDGATVAVCDGQLCVTLSTKTATFKSHIRPTLPRKAGGRYLSLEDRQNHKTRHIYYVGKTADKTQLSRDAEQMPPEPRLPKAGTYYEDNSIEVGPLS